MHYYTITGLKRVGDSAEGGKTTSFALSRKKNPIESHIRTWFLYIWSYFLSSSCLAGGSFCVMEMTKTNNYTLDVMIDQLNKPFGFFIGRELVIWATPVTRFSMASVKGKTQA